MTPERGNELYVGLMSGTSLDGVDVAIVDFAEFPPALRYCSTTPYSESIRNRLVELCRSQTTSLDKLYSLDAELGEIYAGVVNAALTCAGITADQVIAIGCHGQTIRHSPNSAMSHSAQIGDPSRIAVLTGISTVADFRRKDIALGGQAAPLAPAFHRFLFRSGEEDRAVVNIGGIANISYLPADHGRAILGFDTGPGNTLLDYWTEQHRNAPYDDGGVWARSGKVNTELLNRMMNSEPYFQLAAPKSTGTEYFNPSWLMAFLDETTKEASSPADIQATLVELTVSTIAAALQALPSRIENCYLCGGGAHNHYLLERLTLALPECAVITTAALGFDPDFVEAGAFAWLARERINLRVGNIPEVTRARQASVLGAIYAADISV
ncbi:MAG TPA: anhydro-N-acetylmuramic acid kinase [Gammaproteobacteria bacterium]|nr:anhydro-N-acetylmuramic acid kinase [Gammaproteobacteria bacterium]